MIWIGKLPLYYYYRWPETKSPWLKEIKENKIDQDSIHVGDKILLYAASAQDDEDEKKPRCESEA